MQETIYRRGMKRKRGEEKKEEVEIEELTKRKNMAMINLYKAKLMNEENWVEIGTTEMRMNVKKKDKEEN